MCENDGDTTAPSYALKTLRSLMSISTRRGHSIKQHRSQKYIAHDACLTPTEPCYADSRGEENGPLLHARTFLNAARANKVDRH